MKLGDIYVSKTDKDVIQIDSFATRLNTHTDMIIVCSRIIDNSGTFGTIPSNNIYGTQEEIETEYKLLVPQGRLHEFESWDEIFALIGEKDE